MKRAGQGRCGPLVLALGLAVAVCPAAAGDDARALVAPYLEARERGAVGEVGGDVHADASRPADAPEPVAGVSVMLLPRSAALEAELDAVKRASRDSSWSFVAAAERLRLLRADYERALAMAGGGELVRGEVSDGRGRFRFDGVPAGGWLLLAWQEAPHRVSGRKVPRGVSGKFHDNWERTGYAAVTYWRMPVEVRAAESASVSLHERNGWLTVVREEQRLPAQTAPDTPARRR